MAVQTLKPSTVIQQGSKYSSLSSHSPLVREFPPRLSLARVGYGADPRCPTRSRYVRSTAIKAHRVPDHDSSKNQVLAYRHQFMGFASVNLSYPSISYSSPVLYIGWAILFRKHLIYLLCCTDDLVFIELRYPLGI